MTHVQAPRDSVAHLDRDPLGTAEARLVEEWLRPAVGDAAIGFGPPATTSERGPVRVHLTLLGTIPASPARASHQPAPLRLLARYLVTAGGTTDAEAHRIVVALAFAALHAGSPELEREPASPELWLALGVTLRPALLIRTQLEQSRVAIPAPLVREPLVSRWSTTQVVVGRVVGPDDIPITGARIEVVRADLTTYSDHRGEFRLPGVPIGPPQPVLTITAKGQRQEFAAESAPGEALLVRIPLPES